MILSLFLCAIFFVLGLIHLNWVLGGKFGFAESIPTNKNGERVLNPKKVDSAIIGIGLILFSLFYLLKSNLIESDLPNWVFKYLGWIIPAIFIFRAMGEFKYVGFFKKVKNTKFSQWDTFLYAPLCLVIGVIGIFIQVSNNY